MNDRRSHPFTQGVAPPMALVCARRWLHYIRASGSLETRFALVIIPPKKRGRPPGKITSPLETDDDLTEQEEDDSHDAD